MYAYLRRYRTLSTGAKTSINIQTKVPKEEITTLSGVTNVKKPKKEAKKSTRKTSRK